MNGEKGVRAIVLAGKKLPQLEFLELMKQRHLFAHQFLFRFCPMSRIGFFRPELA